LCSGRQTKWIAVQDAAYHTFAVDEFKRSTDEFDSWWSRRRGRPSGGHARRALPSRLGHCAFCAAAIAARLGRALQSKESRRHFGNLEHQSETISRFLLVGIATTRIESCRSACSAVRAPRGARSCSQFAWATRWPGNLAGLTCSFVLVLISSAGL
jgi:hypothetical protein